MIWRTYLDAAMEHEKLAPSWLCSRHITLVEIPSPSGDFLPQICLQAAGYLCA
jgi:hypothetical protein